MGRNFWEKKNRGKLFLMMMSIMVTVLLSTGVSSSAKYVNNNIKLTDPGNQLSAYFARTNGSSNMYLSNKLNPYFVPYKNSPTNAGVSLTKSQLTLNDAIGLDRDFFFVMGTTVYSRQGQGVATWSLINPDWPGTTWGSSAPEGLSSLGVGGMPGAVSISVSRSASNSANVPTTYWANPAEANPMYNGGMYVQASVTDAAGKLHRGGNKYPVTYTGKTVGNDIYSMCTSMIFKYNAKNRKIELYAVPSNSASGNNQGQLLQESNIPTTWNSAGLQWNGVIGQAKNILFTGWMVNSGHTELDIPVRYVDSSSGAVIQNANFKDFYLYRNNWFTMDNANSLANDTIKNNYTIDRFDGGTTELKYQDIVPNNTLSSKGITVYVSKKAPSQVETYVSAQFINKTTGERIRSDISLMPFKVNNYGDTVNLNSNSSLVAAKTEIVQGGKFNLDSVTQTPLNGGNPIPANDTSITTRREGQIVSYYYTPVQTKTTVSVNFVNVKKEGDKVKSSIVYIPYTVNNIGDTVNLLENTNVVATKNIINQEGLWNYVDTQAFNTSGVMQNANETSIITLKDGQTVNYRYAAKTCTIKVEFVDSDTGKVYVKPITITAELRNGNVDLTENTLVEFIKDNIDVFADTPLLYDGCSENDETNVEIYEGEKTVTYYYSQVRS